MATFMGSERTKAEITARIRALSRSSADVGAFRESLQDWILPAVLRHGSWEGIPGFAANCLAEFADLLPAETAAAGVLTAVRALPPGRDMRGLRPALCHWLLSHPRHGLPTWLADRRAGRDDAWRRDALTFLSDLTGPVLRGRIEAGRRDALEQDYRRLLQELRDPRFGTECEAAVSCGWALFRQLEPDRPPEDLWLALLREPALRRGSWRRLLFAAHDRYVRLLRELP